MDHIQDDIKLAYIIAIGIMMIFVVFIILIVLTYNKRQLLYLREKQLKESEYKNQLYKRNSKNKNP